VISLAHKVIFIHIPKCAGQSIEETFLNDLNLNWDDHRYLFGCFEKPSSWNKNIPHRLAHLTAKEMLEFNLLPEEIFNSFYKFTIVRDPVDRLVSSWNYLNLEADFNDWVSSTVLLEYKSKNYFFKSQSEYLFDENNKLLVDDIVPFKSLGSPSHSFYNYLVNITSLSHRNISNKRTIDVSEATKRLIKDLYQKDYEFLESYF
jgi:hypothetical protein